MSLVEAIEALNGRPCSKDEIVAMHKFEQLYEINPDDPLIVVLAMMAKNQLLVDQLPERLEQKARETIEMHSQTLREQSTLIAKELVVTVGNIVAASAAGQKLRLAFMSISLLGGFILGGLCVRLLLR